MIPQNPYDLVIIWFGDKKVDARPADFDDLSQPTKATRYVTTCPHCYQLVDVNIDSGNWIKECNGKVRSYCTICNSGWDDYANQEPTEAKGLYAQSAKEDIMFYYSRENGISAVPVHISVLHLNGIEVESDDIVLEE